MMYVEVVGYDCCRMTQGIWANPDLSNKTKLADLGLNCKMFADDHVSDKLIAALKKQGFKPVHIQSLSYGSNY